MSKDKKVFFLGGFDAEMSRIKEILTLNNQEFHSKDLGWGEDKVSAYSEELAKLPKNAQPVFIELKKDRDTPDSSINIDPVGENWSNASILQVCELIDHKPLMLDVYLAANDHGWIPEMLKVGASQEDVAMIRRAERDAQGITEEHEIEAVRAISEMKEKNGLQIVKMKHSKCAPVTDRLYDPKKKQNLLILSEDGEVNYYGNGLMCKMLQGENTGKDPKSGYDTYTNFGGWTGGSGVGDKNGTGFWGGYPNHDDVVKYIVKNHPDNQQTKSSTEHEK